MSKRTIVLALSAILALIIGTGVALAANVGLSGSNFEIDSDANLKLDGSAPAIDWATVNEIRKADTPSGQQDESFGNGSKEDTANPSVVDGGIPPNKSDLKFFGVYQEGSTSSGFLNLFWSRVQDPTGTTNMDFELNQNKCQHVDNDNNPATPSYNDDGNPNAVDTPTADSTCAGNSITPLRKGDGTGPLADDILIQYDLSNGGVNPTISFRTWTGNQWSGLQSLAGNAVGSINTSTIPVGESDGIGAQDPRTFGEAQVRLSALLGNSTACVGFGSAYLKSRSSDQFNSALKDFVPPQSVNITNCGSVNIIKTDNATTPAALNGAEFTLYKDNAPVGGTRGDEDTITTLKCTTAGTGADAGKCTINAVPFGEYWVVETVTPSGYTTAADQHATVSAGNPTVTLSFVDVRLAATLATAPSVIPNDTATVGTGGETGTYEGTLTFELFDDLAECQAEDNDADAVYSEEVDVPADTDPGTDFSTNNDGDPTGTGDNIAGYTINSGNDTTTYYWQVSYDDAVRTDAVSDCVESTVVTITDDN